jgi:hypothetical protein
MEDLVKNSYGKHPSDSVSLLIRRDVQKFVENNGISRWEEGFIRECVVNVSFLLSN